MSHGFGPVLPDKLLKLVDKRDRHLVKGKTFDEVMAMAKEKVERDIHDKIEGLLRRLDVVYVHSRMDRKTTIGVGLPDFMFSVVTDTMAHAPWEIVRSVAIEVKLPGEDLDEEQENVRAAMQCRPNAWAYHVVYSYAEALAVVRDLGLIDLQGD